MKLCDVRRKRENGRVDHRYTVATEGREIFIWDFQAGARLAAPEFRSVSAARYYLQVTDAPEEARPEAGEATR